MIVLEGLPALSPFRRERLQARLQQIVPGLRVAGAWFTYFIEPAAGPTPDAGALGRILEGCVAFEAPEAGAESRFVVPRLGTLSPWASKATEILRGAGLSVKRVERGTRLDLVGLPPASDPRWAKLARVLHDPMTQSLLLHREDAYERESPRAGEADFIVAKHRNGPTATITVAFQGHYSRFVDMAQ